MDQLSANILESVKQDPEQQDEPMGNRVDIEELVRNFHEVQ